MPIRAYGNAPSSFAMSVGIYAYVLTSRKLHLKAFPRSLSDLGIAANLKGPCASDGLIPHACFEMCHSHLVPPVAVLYHLCR